MLLPLLFVALTLASVKTELYRYSHSGKVIHMPAGVMAPEQVLVNDICLKDRAACQALKNWRGAAKIKSFSSDLPGNSAGAYCRHVGGTELFTQKGDEEILFCVFPDLTALDARALYRHHAGAKR